LVISLKIAERFVRIEYKYGTIQLIKISSLGLRFISFGLPALLCSHSHLSSPPGMKPRPSTSHHYALRNGSSSPPGIQATAFHLIPLRPKVPGV
jgi:hypothetical protein